MKKLKLVYILVAAAMVMCLSNSCKEDDCCVLPPEPTETPQYAKGVLVVNEGGLSGTISHFDRNLNKVENEIFVRTNTESLGGNVRSVEVYQDNIFIVVSGEDKVVQADAKDFLLKGTITGLKQPRHFLGIDSDISYVSQWGEDGLTGSVEIVQTANLSIINTIPMPAKPDRMLQVADKVWVLCGGGSGHEKKVVLINVIKGEVFTEIELRWSPRSIVRDANNKVWIACSGNGGNTNESENGALIRLNTISFEIEETLDLGETVGDVNFDMVTNSNGTVLFYSMNGKVYRHPISESALPTEAFIDDDNIVNLHGLGYDPATNYLYVSDAKDLVSDGEVLRYDADSGAFVDAFTVKFSPNGNSFFGK